MKKVKLYRCKECGELGFASVHGDMCTSCANEMRGFPPVLVQIFEVEALEKDLGE